MLKYQQIAAQLFKYIKSEQLGQGAALPSLNDLTGMYGASKTTVLKALDELEREGLIYQVQGSGTFVRNIPGDDLINFNISHGWTNDFTNNKLENSDVSVQKIMPSKDIAHQLHCSVDTPVFKVQRLKHHQSKILCFETSYYNSEMVPFLDKEIAQKSIFHHISDTYQINVGFSDKYFSVRPLTALESEKLALPESSFGLSVHETFYTVAGQVFDYSEIIYHYQNARFYI